MVKWENGMNRRFKEWKYPEFDERGKLGKLFGGGENL